MLARRPSHSGARHLIERICLRRKGLIAHRAIRTDEHGGMGEPPPPGYSHVGDEPSLRTGAAMLSVMTLMTAGLALAIALAMAPSS